MIRVPVIQQLLSTIGTSDGRLSALMSTLQAVADPAKTKAGEDKDKKPPVNVPRGADGKPTAWVEGMALCRCGVGGGKHLFKDQQHMVHPKSRTNINHSIC